VFLMGKPEDGEYVITMPNMYARGILFGRMVLELGETCVATNEKNDIHADIEFKTKGFFSGTYNAISGKVRRGHHDTGEVNGRWSHSMDFKSSKGEKRVLFDAAKDGKNVFPKTVAPEEEQEPNESRRLWTKLTAAINAKDMDAATEAKSAVEEAQRDHRRTREEKGEQHVPRFFELRNGQWLPKFTAPEDPDECIAAVQKWIWSPPTA